MAFTKDNLLHCYSGITHHGVVLAEEDDYLYLYLYVYLSISLSLYLSISLSNLIVLPWLCLFHNDLPKLVKQQYGMELRSRTLASIKPELSQAMASLLDEVHTSEDAKIRRTATSRSCGPSRRQTVPLALSTSQGSLKNQYIKKIVTFV